MQINNVSAVELSLDWGAAFGKNTEWESARGESIPDALILSLSNFGKVDLEYIIDITGEDYGTVVASLKGAIYQNPATWNENDYEGWETAEEYLSGNMRLKLKAARKANKQYGGRFADNVYAIRKLLPEALSTQDIYVTLGSPWVPAKTIEEFVIHILNAKRSKFFKVTVNHDEYTGCWEVLDPYREAEKYSVALRSTYGTTRMDALSILEKTLNMKTVTVYDEVYSPTTRSHKKRVVNQSETLLALARQQKMIEEFQRWVWKDDSRKELLESIFENRYGCIRRRIFDGSFLTFPGLSDKISLYPYQKNAVARILFSPNTLLAHDVGSGKTYIMIAAGMELKRMGLSKKNLYVVPNNIVSQWKAFFDEMYPKSKVMCIDSKSFTFEKREKTLQQARDGDWDAIIMAYSCFERLPISREFMMKQIRDELDSINQIMEGKMCAPAPLKRKKDQLNKVLLDLCAAEYEDELLYFDDLGITRLFVDEAHNFKNVPIETKTDKVLGISASGSKKCKDMMDKVHYIQSRNGGGGVVLATGTPITNSLTDVFVMQSYLQSGELAMLDLHTFDSWIGMFAERVTEFEVDVDTNSYRLATRFSKFHNLPELTAILSSIADFHQTDPSVDLPDFKGHSDTRLPKTLALGAYLGIISERAEEVRRGTVSRKDDNMLKITTDGRKAALDLRLVDPSASFSTNSKVAKCAVNVYDVYKRSEETLGTQLVFCDTSTPKAGFNMYDELKNILIAKGIPENQIAFVHDATTEAKRAKLFGKVRSGEIRVLIGSTFKLGTGVNVQDRLVAIHHLDVPWRPADMVQRNGRILRQGNRNEEVYVYRYITEGSFDAYSWQLLETKQRFITELLAGSLSDREGTDVDDVVLDYAEVKALAIGNPLVKQRVEATNELSRLLSLHRKAIDEHIKLEEELLSLPGKIENQTLAVERCREDLRWYRAHIHLLNRDSRREARKDLAEAIVEHLNDPSEDTVAINYLGFDIVLPKDMRADSPYVWLQNNGRYYVELGESAQGAIICIENYLDKLSEHLQKLTNTLANLNSKQEALREELSKKEDYTDRIEEVKLRISKIDKKLGVKK